LKIGNVNRLASWLSSRSLSWTRIRQIGFSGADQAFSVGGMFLVNVALARTQSKEEYGVFTLSYSVFTFLAGLHNATILEAYTIHGAGRYHANFPAYARLLWRKNAALLFALTATLVLAWRVLGWVAPAFASHTVLGLALTCGLFLMASFLRRTFYVRHRPDLAAKFSAIFFVTCLTLLWISIRIGILTGFCAYSIVAVSWSIAAIFVASEFPTGPASRKFEDIEPDYWAQHWRYSRWVFATAFVFQLMTQGYYWLAAGFLSVKEVGDLRALYNVVTPVDQVFIALVLLILPLMSFRYSSQQVKGLVPLWRAYCVGCIAITCSFAAFVSIFGKQVIHLLYAGKFDDVAPLVTTLALLPVVTGIGNTINAALKAMEQPKVVFYAYALSGLTTFVVGIPLVTRLGLHGAIYGMVASAAVYTSTMGIAFYWFVRKSRTWMPVSATVKEDSSF
jgi:O-antigen/teichoic acid export membrane protein